MIKRAVRKDVRDIAFLAVELWPEHKEEELAIEFDELLQEKEAAVFLKYIDGTAVGFAQCQLRHDYVEGTNSTPVGYLEGIFVDRKFRRQGIAREMLEACEMWAAECGCTEFASDCTLDNGDSYCFHRSVGFLEANRIICFVRRLGAPKQE